MKRIRFVNDTITINGKEYTHSIKRMEVYETTQLQDSLISFSEAMSNLGKALSNSVNVIETNVNRRLSK